MKYPENYNGEWWFGRLYDKFNNAIAIDDTRVKSIGFAWGFKENGKWNWIPCKTGNKSLYYNAMLFVRFSLPFDFRLQIRWAGKDPYKREYFQCGIGWKLNGRFAITFRFPTDESSSEGAKFANVGQSWGWEYGTK